MLEVDVRNLLPESLREAIDNAMALNLAVDLAQVARSTWVAIATERLHTSQQAYVNAISPVQLEGGIAFVALVGEFPNMVESGFPPFDLRQTLLGPNARGVKTSQSGERYRAILFRRKGEKTTGADGQRFTDVYASEFGEDRARKLGRIAERRAKRLRGNKALGRGLGPIGHSHALDERGNLTLHGGAEHKTDLFHGTKRLGNRQGFGLFRTISTAEPEGWIHPGYQPGAQIISEVLEHAAKMAPRFVESIMRRRPGGGSGV